VLPPGGFTNVAVFSTSKPVGSNGTNKEKAMIPYPKIETLYDRLPTFSVDTTKLRVPAFGNVKTWLLTEKIDGMNIRVGLHPDGGIEFGGRTDNAQIPAPLVQYLRDTFVELNMHAVFTQRDGVWPEVVIFGEGYGVKIQKGGGSYRPDVAVRIFDVNVGGWWLEWDDVVKVAVGLGVSTVPTLGSGDFLPTTEADLNDILVDHSPTAWQDSKQTREAEGIVARADPMLHLRNGERCLWKLKYSDFRQGKKR